VGASLRTVQEGQRNILFRARDKARREGRNLRTDKRERWAGEKRQAEGLSSN
jgi:hypothetical protein